MGEASLPQPLLLAYLVGDAWSSFFVRSFVRSSVQASLSWTRTSRWAQRHSFVNCYISQPHTYAEYTTVSPETLALKPESLNFDEAAAISGGATTAWTALFENGALQVGQCVLIHGAAGGVGMFAIQFARWKGGHGRGHIVLHIANKPDSILH
jgi:NADPH:quinone reductase-like Zn-dependent oxidoreductase